MAFDISLQYYKKIQFWAEISSSPPEKKCKENNYNRIVYSCREIRKWNLEGGGERTMFWMRVKCKLHVYILLALFLHAWNQVKPLKNWNLLSRLSFLSFWLFPFILMPQCLFLFQSCFFKTFFLQKLETSKLSFWRKNCF